MKLHRIQVKAFVEDASRIELSALIPVFHRWIQTDALDEMLIDVGNYEHVPEGPGILLVAHEADYALDVSGGAPGLLYTRKRDLPGSIGEAVELSLRSLFKAVSLLEEEPSLGGTYRFRTGQLEIRFLDRLQVPNRPESVEVVREDVERVLKSLYGVDTVALDVIADDARLPFAVRVTLPTNPEASVLARRPAVSE